MTKLLEQAIEQLRHLPEEMQDTAARVLLFQLQEEPEPGDLEAVAGGRAEIARGEFITLEQLEHELLILSNQASRSLRRAPWADRDQIKAALRLLCDNPYTGDVKLLKGTNGIFRRRVGEWRILYELNREKSVIVVTAIKRRGSNTY